VLFDLVTGHRRISGRARLRGARVREGGNTPAAVTHGILTRADRFCSNTTRSCSLYAADSLTIGRVIDLSAGRLSRAHARFLWGRALRRHRGDRPELPFEPFVFSFLFFSINLPIPPALFAAFNRRSLLQAARVRTGLRTGR